MFPKRKNVFVIAVSLHANGNSSYRDSNNIIKITKEKWNAETIILTDSLKYTKDKNTILIKNKNHFLDILSEKVNKYSKTHDILFTISAHGYNKYSKTEIDHTDEYIIINGQHVLDSDIRNYFYKNMDDNCLSLCLVDTCHSGTMLDLPFISTDGKNYKKVENILVNKPYSYCISACNDNQLAGEDISYYGGFGGKLICIFLDYLNKNNLEILPFYLFVKKTFMSQKYQKSQPIFSSTHNEFP